MAIRILASSTLVLTFFLILLGGIVHSSGSSLACPDWPLCYGQFFPEMRGGVAIEHSHRLLASFIGLLTIALVVMSTRQPERGLKRLAMLALALVIIQGVLGGITVLYQLPTAISTTHLAISMLFFSLILWITLSSFAGSTPGIRLQEGRSWILLATGLIYCQIVLGGLVRHTGASAACPDLPFCFGMPWPLGLHPSTQLHMLHRWFGVLVGLVVLSMSFFLLRQPDLDKPLKFIAKNAVFLIIIQIMVGMASVWTQMNMIVVTAHLGIGVLLLASGVSLCFFTRPTRGA